MIDSDGEHYSLKKLCNNAVPTVRFEAWDKLNRPIPPHAPFKLTKEECYRNPGLMQDPLLLYCPAKETAIWLDPEDPRDRRLRDAYNSKKLKNMFAPEYEIRRK